MILRWPRRNSSEVSFLLVWSVLLSSLWMTAVAVVEAGEVFNIREYGAVGDGKALDTLSIQKAIDACSQAGGGQVRFPPGQYLSGTIHLKSHITLFLEAGARLVGTTDLKQYKQPVVPDFMPEAKWGKWHRALILAEGLKEISIAGTGVINGNKVFDPTGEEKMRGPHTFVFVECRDVMIRDVTFLDSANYAVFFQVSDDVEILNVKFVGGWDGVHFRGAPQHDCKNINIIGCRFYTGDDSIAGRYWNKTLISNCIINSSCNGIRLIGPAEHLIIQDCFFYGPGVRPHRSSDRYNMLAGINLQPGAWDATRGKLDDVLISDIIMHNVSTPFHFSLKPGNTAERITVDRVTATGVYRAAASVESWAESPFKHVVFRDMTMEFEGGGTRQHAKMEVKSPGVDARPLPAWGFYARKVENLELDQIRFRLKKEDLRPVVICQAVTQLTMQDVDYPSPHDEQVKAVVLRDVDSVKGNEFKKTKEQAVP
ncbi:MAG: right-handed parallel beta-helix repeat-containing protein [Sedimentisphaerales bacterium]|nr:right-handed parallel beta-helix repeat-containing protein [Sedimentisphaerales bacterium]